MKREATFDTGRSEGGPDKTEERKRLMDKEGARGVEGAGRVNEKVWTVEAGYEAMILTSREKDS